MKEIVKKVEELQRYLEERGCSYVISVTGVKTSDGAIIQGYNGISFNPESDPTLPAFLAREARTNTQMEELLGMTHYLMYDEEGKAFVDDVQEAEIKITPETADGTTES